MNRHGAALRTKRTTAAISDERGVAMPVAMMALVLLVSLGLVFLTLGQSEPVVSVNHLRTAQARVLAEAGVERVVWALSNGALGVPATGVVAPSPYDGLQVLELTTATGGFTVRVTGVTATEVTVDAEGWTPRVGRPAVTGYDVNDTRTKAHRSPCALCVKGDLEVRGSAVIEARNDTSCGSKYGVTASGSVCIGGGSCNGNSGAIYGAVDGNTTANQAGDFQSGVVPSAFDAMTLSTSQLDALRAMARAQGTYHSGHTTFNSSSQVPSGKSVVFVDGDVSMSGNPYAGGSFTGWMIVMGSATVNGNGTLNGLLYAQNDVSSSSGTNTINGLVISQNTSNASGIDTSAGGNMTINFDCTYARGNNQLPRQWFMKPGSYREPSD
jgi:Tfp pilus assembly protein PilX